MENKSFVHDIKVYKLSAEVYPSFNTIELK